MNTEALPTLLGERTGTDGSLILRLAVAADHPLFSGHFPGLPLLPGVAQLHWAACFGRERFGIAGGFTRLINLKFQKPVLPGCELDLLFTWDAARRQLAFTYTSAAGQHASGKIEFAA